MAEALRLLVALVVVGLLARTVRPAWRHRDLALRVWSGIRPRHLLGGAALLALVLSVAVALLAYVPVTRIGLGTLIGLSGNAVFAPIERVAAPGAGVDVLPLLLAGGFLLALLALFPWLAYTEELTFRRGLERAGLARELWVALRFGLAHLIMLVPLGAALAIAVAGFAYGRIYRRAYRRGGLSEALLAATRWHVTFNSLVVLGVIAGLALGF
jgi:hypothetical protein